MDPRIEVIEGDITTQKVDAIVNAANSSLLGGGGVDGAIHRAAGPGLLAECRGLGRCPTGQARVTGAHDLPSRWIIHAVGPVWRGGTMGEEIELASAYRESLRLAVEQGARTVAFPLISAGAYGFPLDRACGVALAAIDRFLAGCDDIDRVVVVCFGEDALAACRRAARAD